MLRLEDVNSSHPGEGGDVPGGEKCQGAGPGAKADLGTGKWAGVVGADPGVRLGHERNFREQPVGVVFGPR